MPVPSPTPTEEQLVIVGEITYLSTDTVLSMISADTQGIADAKWARTLSDIDLWADLENEAGDIKKVGSIEFFEGTISSSRLSFRNKILARYGYPLLTSDSGEEALTSISSLEYF